jgi:hypothetical protein
MAEYKTTVTETEDGGRTITSGNMTEQEAARLTAERERTKNMNTSDSASAASDALDKNIAAKKRYTEMQNILASGKHKSMSDEEKEAFVKEYKKLKLDYSFAEGGVVPMNEMSKQIDMFQDGGLMDEGGTVDPVSGNDVPPGSTQEEVRDDIPAQLSEGEFVFPADVVRYFGLEKLMEMRQEAKMGLQRMEDMGQMGNSEEAIMPDNLPFDIDDIDMEDDNELEMNIGGLVNSPVSVAASNALGQAVGQVGTAPIIPPSMGRVGTQVVVYGPDGTAYGNAAIAQAAGVNNYTMTPPTVPTAPATPAAPAGQAAAPVQAASAQFQPAGTKFTPYTSPTVNMPSFQETIGKGVPYVDYDPNKSEKEQAEENTPVQPTEPYRAETGGSEDGFGEPPSPSVKGTVTGYTSPASTMSKVGGFLTKDVEANANFFGGNKAFGMSNKALRNATFDQAIYQLGSISPSGAIGSTLSKQFGFTNATMNEMAVAGQQGKEAALTTLGFTRASQLQTNQQATMYGTMISAAHAAAKKGEDVTVALAKEINNPAYAEVVKDAAVSALQGLGYTSDNITNQELVGTAIGGYRAAADSYRDDAAQTKSSGTVRDSKGNPVTSKSGVVMTQSARDQMNAELEAARTADAKADSLAAERARQRSNLSRDDGVIGTPTENDVSAAKAAAEKATRDAVKAGTDYGDEFGNIADNDSSQDFNDAFGDDGGSGGFSDSDGDTGPDNEGSGGISDSFGGGDYKGAFVGKSYKKNKLANQMKRSGLASKK